MTRPPHSVVLPDRHIDRPRRNGPGPAPDSVPELEPLDEAATTSRRARFGIRLVKICGVALVGVLLLGTVSPRIADYVVELPDFPHNPQTSTAVYADGRHPVATYATENRQQVPLSRVPRHVQDAVLAAEDAGFRNDDDGISVLGIGRAVLGLVRGDQSSGGGSTITQQYVRNALDLTRERSYSRKAKEIALAGKLARSTSKDKILEGYLNTIYFGRGAFGIQAASQAYFGVDVDEITVAQSAVIAAVIKDPTNFDPRLKPESAQDRWGYLLDRMVDNGFLSADDRAGQRPPATVDRKASASARRALRTGWNGVLRGKIEQELADILTDQQLYTGGYTITTTLDWTEQRRAARAARDQLRRQDPRMTAAVVSIEPTTGKVKAYYGGEGGYGNLDMADVPRLAAESFRPYLLAAGRTRGVFADKLSDRELVAEVGKRNVARFARAAGIRSLGGKDPLDPAAMRTLSAGLPAVTVLDHAAGYATFAADGRSRQPYLIEKVSAPDSSVVWERQPGATKRAFPAGLTDGLTEYAGDAAMQSGTSDGHTNAWMCGYNAERAVAVWVGSDSDDFPMRDARTGERVDGWGIPQRIWDRYLGDSE
jgi:membrane peptidoglycan carboxypeptidase